VLSTDFALVCAKKSEKNGDFLHFVKNGKKEPQITQISTDYGCAYFPCGANPRNTGARLNKTPSLQKKFEKTQKTTPKNAIPLDRIVRGCYYAYHITERLDMKKFFDVLKEENPRILTHRSPPPIPPEASL
jgi:hypothetical protein